MAWLQKIWRDAVGANVIGATIIAVAGAAGTYFLDLWPKTWEILGAIWRFSQLATPVSNWILGLLGMCAAAVLVVLAALLWENIIRRPANQPSWKAYLSDSFFGIRWHWQYGSEGTIYGLYACCEACAYQMHPQYQGSYIAAQQLYYQCDMCGRNHGPFADDLDHFESKVKRHIQQKLRTGSWTNTLPNTAT